MVKTPNQDKVSKFARIGTLAASALGATVMGISSVFAADMDGPQLTGDLVTGMKAGVADSVDTIQTTVSNAVVGEIAIMFIGLAAAVGVIMYFLKHHRRI